MTLSDAVAGVRGFLQAGYPGLSTTGHIPLLALLRRRLSDEETIQIANDLIASGKHPVDSADVWVAITKLTDEMPSMEDTARVRQRIVATGCPVHDSLES